MKSSQRLQLLLLEDDAKLDQIDHVMLKRVAQLCNRSDPRMREGLQTLKRGGWSFTGMLGLLPAVLSTGTDAEDPFVEIPHHPAGHVGMAHRVLISSFSVEPLDRIGKVLYRSHRIDGKRHLYVHPIIHEYIVQVSSAGQQVGGEERDQEVGPNMGGQKVAKPIDPTCIIGTGKDGSAVFLARCLGTEIPGVNETCCVEYRAPDSQVLCGDATLVNRRYGSKTLLKFNIDPYDTKCELRANDKIHQWMSQSNILTLTSLHQTLKKVTVSKINHQVFDLVALQQFSGDVSRLQLEERDFVSMLKSVLLVLHVIHENRHLHLDIKPQNILYGRSATNATMVFALADFGIVDDMAQVHHDFKRGRYSGTYGFMSPLLLRDDLNNGVFPVFKAVASEATGQQLHTQDIGRVCEEHQRSLEHHMPKIDMHSVGLTLYNILSKQQGALAKGEMRRRCIKLIYGLLFFGPGTIATTSHALKVVQDLWPNLH